MARIPRIRFLGTSESTSPQYFHIPKILVREPWLMVPRQKPIGRVTVNKADPIANQVILAWLATPALVDVDGRQGSLVGTSTYTIHASHGLGRDFGQGYIDFPYTTGALAPATLLVVAEFWQATWKIVGGVGTSVRIASRDASPDVLAVYGNDATQQIRSEYTMPSGVHAVLGKCDGTAVSLWQNGIKLTPSGTGTWTKDTHQPRITLGSNTDPAVRDSSTHWDYPIFAAIAWNRALLDAECAKMSEDPYRLFIPA